MNLTVWILLSPRLQEKDCSPIFIFHLHFHPPVSLFSFLGLIHIDQYNQSLRLLAFSFLSRLTIWFKGLHFFCVLLQLISSINLLWNLFPLTLRLILAPTVFPSVSSSQADLLRSTNELGRILCWRHRWARRRTSRLADVQLS